MLSESVPLSEYPLLMPHLNCDGHGWRTIVDADGHERVTPCTRCSQDRVLESLTKWIPPRFNTFLPLPAEVDAWIFGDQDGNRPAEGLYLAGPVGSGKTHLAYSAVVRWCIATMTHPGYGPDLCWYRATQLLDELRPSNDDHRRIIDRCRRARLLVIDDLGAEKPSEWTAERLYEIVDARYLNRQEILVTSNVPPAKLGEHVGERVASRFAEMCSVVPVTSPDRRRQPAEVA